MKKLLLGLLLITAVWAINGRNIYGSTGYLVMPSAEALPYKTYNAGINAYLVNDDGVVSGGSEHPPYTYEKGPRHYSLNYWKYNLGLGWSDWMEVSVSGRGEREGLLLNAKMATVLNDNDQTLRVAAGAENISSLGTYQDYASLYMVMSKRFVGHHSLSIGFVCRSVGRNLPTSLMVGGEFYATEHLSLLGDFVSHGEVLPHYVGNVGLRMRTDSKTYFEAALLNIGYDKDYKFKDPRGHLVTAYPLTFMLSMTVMGVLE